MRKGFKVFILILISVLCLFFLYNTFSAPPANINILESEVSLMIRLIANWGPMFVFIVFYIIFLWMFSRLIKIGERIAKALEKKNEASQSGNI